MRRIEQIDEAGCGLACVAMATGATYAAVRRTYRDVCKRERSEQVEPTQLPMLKKIMSRHGLVIVGRERRFTPQNPKPYSLGFDALLKVNPRRGGEEWHWMIWDHRRRRWLDPKAQPYKRLKFVSYWQLGRATDSPAGSSL